MVARSQTPSLSGCAISGEARDTISRIALRRAAPWVTDCGEENESNQSEVADARTIATTCATIAAETGGEDIVVLDLKGISSLADYFVLVSGTSVPHLKALSRDLRHETEERLGERPRSTEGEAASLWLVLDYVDVVVHILHEEARRRYALEDLWSDAARVEFDRPPTDQGTAEATKP